MPPPAVEPQLEFARCLHSLSAKPGGLRARGSRVYLGEQRLLGVEDGLVLAAAEAAAARVPAKVAAALHGDEVVGVGAPSRGVLLLQSTKPPVSTGTSAAKVTGCNF